ncbi:MAG: hypothetical protein GQ477_00050 [Nanohaloarchaea archaeon]|nr:hypothetical protein [Candidatus Nanohaloarchaea archaeon]
MAEKIKEITIKDYVLSPVEKIKISYKGPRPLAILKQSEMIMKIGADVASSGLFTTLLKFDAIDGDFYTKIHAIRGYDNFTKAYFHTDYDGHQNLETSEGSINIEIYAILETKFPYANSFQKTLWWAYYKTFYKTYRNRCRIASEKYIYKLRDTFKNISGMEELK